MYCCGTGRGVAPIGEGVNGEVFDAGGCSGFAKRIQVRLLGMHTAL